MKKRPDISDIELRIRIQERVDSINKKIEERRKKYLLITEYLRKGFDVTNGKEITSKEEMERRIIEEREKFYDYKQRKISEMIDIECEINDEDTKNEINDDNHSSNRNIRNIKRKKLRNVKYIAAGAILSALLIFGTNKITTYINHEDEINRKMQTYSDEIKQVVNGATYSRIGNLVYQNGVVVEKLDEKDSADKEYQYIEYGDIAKYIKESENPDLAAFALYENFGMASSPKYHRIVSKTFKTLDFDGSINGSEDNFSNYLNENGYDSYSEYRKACKKELISDGDNILDNINVKIKKMTR
ncbi:MAG: hypothetical protein J6O56_02315 [Bacilli bacterium]|nr:hypothetical protein [Bacilli bacterium]